jgi:hypothetical protein
MLPYPYNTPTILSVISIDLPVFVFVFRYFLSPECFIGLGLIEMNRAGMPEAGIEKNYSFVFWQNNIRLAEIIYRILSVSETLPRGGKTSVTSFRMGYSFIVEHTSIDN